MGGLGKTPDNVKEHNRDAYKDSSNKKRGGRGRGRGGRGGGN